MNTNGKVIWQQAAGDTNRNYVKLCQDFGVILNGPGRCGRWPDCALEISKISSTRKVSDIRRFAEEMKDGDIVVLRVGTKDIRAVGEVVGPYFWSEEFGDIDGWDLQHGRRVRWLWKGEISFQTYDLKQGDTTQRLTGRKVEEWLQNLDINDSAFSQDLPELPISSYQETTIEDVSQNLYDEGVASYSIDRLVSEIGDLVRTARWYQQFDVSPSEHETVCYLVAPLFRALGWTPQRMAVEWNKIDLALFQKLPRRVETLSAVVEAKRMDRSCLQAVVQANAYAKDYKNCQTLIVTDGIRYAVYKKRQDEYLIFAYLNLTRFSPKYSVYNCEGAAKALLAMTPEWFGRSDSI